MARIPMPYLVLVRGPKLDRIASSDFTAAGGDDAEWTSVWDKCRKKEECPGGDNVVKWIPQMMKWAVLNHFPCSPLYSLPMIAGWLL